MSCEIYKSILRLKKKQQNKTPKKHWQNNVTLKKINPRKKTNKKPHQNPLTGAKLTGAWNMFKCDQCQPTA